ncbi:MAG: phosphatase PAP2 family protein [Acidobacteria bacterium]|nr:phosphatase PAP2 family protein [Acidobacteriota bacterium]
MQWSEFSDQRFRFRQAFLFRIGLYRFGGQVVQADIEDREWDKKTMTRHIFITIAVLVVSLILFDVTRLDLAIQNMFFDDRLKHWLVDRHEPVLNMLFYRGIKVVLVLLFAVFCGVCWAKRRTDLIRANRFGIAVFVVSALVVPATVNSIKRVTNIPCPRDLQIYGGAFPYRKIFHAFPATFEQPHRCRCFPGGHASGGFAFLGLFFMFKQKRSKGIAVVSALSLGWAMGTYKMAIGDHFFSHNLISMELSWLLVLLVRMMLHRVLHPPP